MNHLNNNMTKMILLVLVAAVLLVALNLNHKKLGKEVALLGTLAVVLVAVYLGNNMMVLPEEDDEEEASNNLLVNNVPVNNVPSEEGLVNNGLVNNGLVNNGLVNNGLVNNGLVNAEANEANEVNAANYEDDVNVEHVVEGFANHSGSNGNAENNRPEVNSHDMSNSAPQDVNFSNNSANNNNCLPRDVLNPEDLLPSSVAPNNWDTPANPGGLDGPNFLNPEHLVGVNTVGQSLRNANRQLRSEPANPQVKVSPWLQTTIEPDTNRKPLEIGECA